VTGRPLSALTALAAQLRLTALGLMAELMAWLGAGMLAAALRRRMARDIAELERFATGIVVLTALKTLPSLPDPPRGGRRPRRAPKGFAWAAGRWRPMRAMQRKLFPPLRDLSARLRRFDALLDDLAASAAKLVPAIERVPPAMRLVAVAPPAAALASRMAPSGRYPVDSS
jgi:hypothetical protein